MSTIKCPNCGNSLPEDSIFCNKCGTRIDVGSLDDDKRDYEDWSDDRDYGRSGNGGSKRNSNENKSGKTIIYVIGIVLLAWLAIFAINKMYFSGNNDKKEAEPVDIVDNSNSAAADALQRALNENNYVGDGATIVYAMRIKGSEPGVNDKIIGITQLTGRGDDSFYKLYELTQNGDKWNIDPEHVKKISTSGRDITFDQNRLKAGVDVIPQAPEIEGKKYFFYAFMSTPSGGTSNSASVVLNLYDVESRNITSATYEGTFQNVGGEQSIVCTPASGNSEVVKWMNEQARNFIRILSMGANGEDNSDKAEEAKPAETPAATAAPAAQETQQAAPAAQQSAVVGEEADKDTPMFSKDQIVDTKQAGNYKVFLLKDGRVVRYDKSTGKNAVIHTGGAQRIGFKDTEKGILNIRTSDDNLKEVNLNGGGSSQAKPAEKKEEPKPAAAGAEEKKE